MTWTGSRTYRETGVNRYMNPMAQVTGQYPATVVDEEKMGEAVCLENPERELKSCDKGQR